MRTEASHERINRNSGLVGADFFGRRTLAERTPVRHHRARSRSHIEMGNEMVNAIQVIPT